MTPIGAFLPIEYDIRLDGRRVRFVPICHLLIGLRVVYADRGRLQNYTVAITTTVFRNGLSPHVRFNTKQRVIGGHGIC